MQFIMPGISHQLEPILNRFSFLRTGHPSVRSENAGGFSGAEIWRIQLENESYCLKKFPASSRPREQLLWVHAVLRHVYRQGLTRIAAPLPDDHGNTILTHEGNCFELSRWLPGNANFEQSPSPQKLVSAVNLLAQFHQQASSYQPAVQTKSQGIAERHAQLLLILRQPYPIDLVTRRDQWAELAQLGKSFLQLVPHVAEKLKADLQRAENWVVPCQPCIRDVWSEHVLFTGEQVTGLIDFGAMRIDNIATDIARLVGSLVRDDPVLWQQSLATYQQIRPLSEIERELISVFDRSAVVLGGFNWLRWIFAEGRTFKNRERVHQRFQYHLERLRTSVEQLSPIVRRRYGFGFGRP